MAKFNLSDIPVLTKTPTYGQTMQQMVIRATLLDPLAVPNGILVAFMGEYTPGSYQEFGALPDGSFMMSVRDFALAAVPPAATVYVGPAGEQRSFELPPLDLSGVLVRRWDAILIAWNLTSPTRIPIDLSQTIESVRCALIVRNAFELTS
jgi:hypothetical protein